MKLSCNIFKVPRLFIVALACAVFFAIPRTAPATPVEDEYSIKAAFIYNFTKFIEWPADVLPPDRSPFILGIIGENPFGASMDILEGKTIKGHPLEIKTISDLEEIGTAHILFISSSEKYRLSSLCRSIQQPVLTISDTKGFVENGGDIELITVRNKIRFAVNLGALRHRGLKASSHLLKLAINVQQ